MSDPAFVFPPPTPVAIPVTTRGLFPVRRIFCIARNYAEHAKEMGGDPSREPPFFFTKPADAIVAVPAGTSGIFPYPSLSQDVHHELELVVALGAGGNQISVAAAPQLIYGYAVGLDMTRRDLQAAAKAKGRPWDIAKSFDASAPIGAITPMQGQILRRASLALEVNGIPRQSGNVSDMIWSIAEIIATLSEAFTLCAGDLIFTGTPAGVGAVTRGDTMLGKIEGLAPLSVRVV